MPSPPRKRENRAGSHSLFRCWSRPLGAMSLSTFSRKLFLNPTVFLKIDDLDVGSSCSEKDAVNLTMDSVKFACRTISFLFKYLRMIPGMFKCLLNKLEVRVTKTIANFRKPLKAKQRLVITLR